MIGKKIRTAFIGVVVAAGLIGGVAASASAAQQTAPRLNMHRVSAHCYESNTLGNHMAKLCYNNGAFKMTVIKKPPKCTHCTIVTTAAVKPATFGGPNDQYVCPLNSSGQEISFCTWYNKKAGYLELVRRSKAHPRFTHWVSTGSSSPTEEREAGTKVCLIYSYSRHVITEARCHPKSKRMKKAENFGWFNNFTNGPTWYSYATDRCIQYHGGNKALKPNHGCQTVTEWGYGPTAGKPVSAELTSFVQAKPKVTKFYIRNGAGGDMAYLNSKHWLTTDGRKSHAQKFEETDVAACTKAHKYRCFELKVVGHNLCITVTHRKHREFSGYKAMPCKKQRTQLFYYNILQKPVAALIDVANFACMEGVEYDYNLAMLSCKPVFAHDMSWYFRTHF